MKRPWWHDLVIVVSIVTLGVVGFMAIWGDSVRSLWPAASETTDGPTRLPAPPSSDKDLL